MINIYSSKNSFVNYLKKALDKNPIENKIVSDLSEINTGTVIFFQDPYLDLFMDFKNLGEKVLNLCLEKKLNLVFIDTVNIYGYSEKAGVDEEYRHLPTSKAGKEHEDFYKKLKESKVNYIILRFPDFIGKGANYFFNDFFQSWKNIFLLWPGLTEVNHEFIFADDAANVVVNILKNKNTKGEYNIQGDKYTVEQIAAAVNELTGIPVKIKKLTGFSLWLSENFNLDSIKKARSKIIAENAFLYSKPVLLNGSKYESEFNKIERKNLYEGIKDIYNEK